jgi:DNA-binding NtrC family response regulator
LIVDDLFGRVVHGQRNRERADLCGQFLIEDVTRDEEGKGVPARVKSPIAQAVFCRGQKPACSVLGDDVVNDLGGVLAAVREGWKEWRPERPRWAMVLVDLCFFTGRVTSESNARTQGIPEGRPGDEDPKRYFGLELLRAIHAEFPDLPVVILSSKSRQDVSRDFSHAGALGFLPRSEERSTELLKEYIWKHGLVPDDAGEMVGHSKALYLALRAARRAATDRRNVLIRGERGTGKELLARYIHRHSLSGGDRPMVVVDSGALSPQLYASELFGHRRGAFTGADRDRVGRIVQANGGDLFLDEIANMPLDVQTGLLRVIEQRVVTPVGAQEGSPVDVRFMAATNEDLPGKAAVGQFREDLLDRLREAGTVFAAPLRDRMEDLEAIVEHVVREAEAATPGAMRRQIEPETFARLRSYHWPGNIRELRNYVFSAVANYPDVEHLVPGHIHIETRDAGTRGQEPDPPTGSRTKTRSVGDSLEALLTALTTHDCAGVAPSELVGKLPLFQDAYARLVSRLLAAAIEATRRPSLEHPGGEVLIHPAMKLLTGDKNLTGSRAADMVKRLLQISPRLQQELLADSALNEAYDTALRLRPKKPPGPIGGGELD